MKITTLVEKETDVKILEINLHLRDNFCGELRTSEGETVCGWEDEYVPNDLVPGEYGDYMNLIIDIDTGRILNWETPTAKKLKEIIDEARKGEVEE